MFLTGALALAQLAFWLAVPRDLVPAGSEPLGPEQDGSEALVGPGPAEKLEEVLLLMKQLLVCS